MTKRIPGCLVTAAAGAQAPWLVLVHGVSQDHQIFARQVEHFAPHFRVLRIDLPGHGTARDMAGPYGLREFADHIEAAICAHLDEPAIFWGTHLGASAGLVAACDAPELFKLLLLEAPVYPGRVPASVSGLFSDLTRILARDGLDAARAYWWQYGPWFDEIRADPLRRRAEEHRRLIDDFGGGPWREQERPARPLDDMNAKLAALRTPVTLINGERDVADFREAADMLACALTNCRQRIIKAAGGFPLWEFPDAANQLAFAEIQKENSRSMRV